jgi:hypothetical protein
MAPALFVIVASLAWLACSDSDTATSPGDESANRDDRTPPQAVGDLTLTYPVVGGSALLSWTAPRDEGGSDDSVDRYEIRYSYSSPLEWELAIPVTAPPDPAPAGDPESYSFDEPRRGRDLYAAVLSFDLDDNASSVSNVAHIYVPGMTLEGRCVDAMSSAGIEGLEVQVTGRHVRTSVTDARGYYRFDDLAAGLVHVDVRGSATGTLYHNYYYAVDLGDDLSREQYMVEYTPTELPAGVNVLSLLSRALAINNYKTALIKWQSFPVDVYAPAFVNTGGVDYEDVCRRAVEHWNDRIGSELFRLVGAQPVKGVWFRFRTRQDMAPHVGVTHHENDAAGFPKTSDISIVDDLMGADLVWEIALHELGHTLRFGHLPQGYLLYGGRPLPATVTNDEVMMTKLYLALPNGANMLVYGIGAPE